MGNLKKTHETPLVKLLITLEETSDVNVQSRFVNAFAAGLLAMVFIVASIPAQAKSAPESFADLAEKLLPAVVNISTTQTSGGSKEAVFYTKIAESHEFESKWVWKFAFYKPKS